jgi:hypothetical protein
MKSDSTLASHLALLAALAGLLMGAAALWLGFQEDAIACCGFGGASLLQLAPALSLRVRIRDGLGNRGLERDWLTLRAVSHLLRLLAMGIALASVSALVGERAPQAGMKCLALSVLAVGIQLPLWLAKRRFARDHPALDLDADRARAMLELAGLLLAGSLLGRWFPWADAATGLLLAVRLFLEGRTLAKGTILQAAACVGSGCNCG